MAGSSQALTARKRITTAATERRPDSTRTLSPEIGAHHRDVVLSKTADDFVRKVVSTSGRRASVAPVESGPAFFDVILQPVVDIVVLAAFGNFSLVVEFDFIHQKLGEALRLAMHVLIFGAKAGGRRVILCWSFDCGLHYRSL